jgi:5-methylthioadenosine/S-adenosylhomocysteine deaminase
MSLVVSGGLVLADLDRGFERMDILIEGSRITEVRPGIEARPGDRVVDASGHLVIAGLVNAHTHAHNHLAKGAIDRMPLEIWLQFLAARVAGRTPREVYVGAAIGAIEMAKTGTTCACEMAGILPWPADDTIDAVAQAYADVGLRVNLAAQVADLTPLESVLGLERILPSHLQDTIRRRPPMPVDEVFGTLERAVARWHGAQGGRIRFGVGPTLMTACSDPLLERCADFAARHQVSIQTHLSETRIEADTARARYGHSATEHLRALGLMGERTLLAHAIWIDDAEIELIAESGSSVAHNPVSNLKLGAGVAPWWKLVDRGCRIALGTDGSASSDNQNLFGTLRQAAILHRVHEADYDRWPSAADVVLAATVGGARAAGFESETGRVAPGYLADLVLMDRSATYFHPANNLVAQLVHCEVGSSVSTVIVDGRLIVENGRTTNVDEGALLAEADEIALRAAGQMRDLTSLARDLAPYIREVYLAPVHSPLPWA